MRTWVIDASVAVKWLVLKDMSDIAKELYGFGDHLPAPKLIATEVANVLARKTAQGLLAHDQAVFHFRAFSNFLPDSIDLDDLITPALENACTLRHPIYDMIYLEAARQLDAQLVTADRRFAAKIVGTEFAEPLVLLSDWRAA